MSMNTSSMETNKLARLKELVSDENILAGANRIALTQEDLNDLIENKVIYLSDGHFTFPVSIPNITYIGINMPSAEFEGVPFEKGIHTVGVKIDINKYLDENYDLFIGDDTQSRENFYRFLDTELKYDNRSLEVTSEKAQCVIGIYYMSKEEHSEAISWLRKSAEQNFANAQFLLGACYEDGRGVEQDKQEAVKWYRMAAEHGHAKAQLALGRYYDHEEDAPDHNIEDYKEAVKWYQMAAEQGLIEAQRVLGECYLNRYSEIRSEMPDSFDDWSLYYDNLYRQWKELGVKWLRMAAEQGDEEAQYELGYAYYDSYDFHEYVGADLKEGVRWYRMAAKQGNKDAQKKLGEHYSKGIDKNYRESAKWYHMAAEQGDKHAQKVLGDYYYNGKGVVKDRHEAAKWYSLAAKQGDYDAKDLLKKCFK